MIRSAFLHPETGPFYSNKAQKKSPAAEKSMAGTKNDDTLFVYSQRLKKFSSALKMALMTTQVTTGK